MEDRKVPYDFTGIISLEQQATQPYQGDMTPNFDAEDMHINYKS